MSDYRDDRGALRERNAALEKQLDEATQALAEREREVAELRLRVPEEAVLPPKRDLDPTPAHLHLPPNEGIPDWKRPAGIGIAVLLLVFLMSGIGLSPRTSLVATIVVGALILVVITWPRKR